MVPVAEGEELTIDYAFMDTSLLMPTWERRAMLRENWVGPYSQKIIIV